jgi:hypothetical protein
MKLKFKLMAACLAVVTASVIAVPAAIAAAAPAAQKPAGSLPVPITGTFTNQAGTGTFAGQLDITKFVNQGGIAAVGTLTGTLTDAAGNVLGTVNQQITMPLAQANGTCQILHLELGPLDLNLLGLMVHLDKVVLDITAQQGPGNLLGNLLCAIAGLLDQNRASPNAITQLLNQILRALG